MKRAAEPSKGTGKEGTRDRAGENGGTAEARVEAASREAAVRRNCGRTERKSRRLSSRKRNGHGRKEADGKRKTPRGEHLRNSCGSESGKGEKKRTAMLSTGTGIERTGNQA